MGPNWPSGGEIDIIEGVHKSTSVATTLHTNNGCAQYTYTSPITGSWITRNCYIDAAGQGTNQGCSINGAVGSFGAPFNSGNGGVYATLWNSNGIQVWFWPRSSVPADITAGAPQPTGWGNPYVVAAAPSR